MGYKTYTYQEIHRTLYTWEYD